MQGCDWVLLALDVTNIPSGLHQGPRALIAALLPALTSVAFQLLEAWCTTAAFAAGLADAAQSHGCWLPEQEL